jgi:hypothetical protein
VRSEIGDGGWFGVGALGVRAAHVRKKYKNHEKYFLTIEKWVSPSLSSTVLTNLVSPKLIGRPVPSVRDK